jgi:hypothetical protein
LAHHACSRFTFKPSAAVLIGRGADETRDETLAASSKKGKQLMPEW